MSDAHAALLRGFYEAFARRDAEPLRAAYAPDARFSDPVFPALRGAAIGDMWAMLCATAKDFRLEFGEVRADGTSGSARWEAWYRFGRRPVHNVVAARFTFRDGRIAEHRDDFDFPRWSRQALGPVGLLLGWSPLLRRAVAARAGASLAAWQAKR